MILAFWALLRGFVLVYPNLREMVGGNIIFILFREFQTAVHDMAILVAIVNRAMCSRNNNKSVHYGAVGLFHVKTLRILDFRLNAHVVLDCHLGILDVLRIVVVRLFIGLANFPPLAFLIIILIV